MSSGDIGDVAIDTVCVECDPDGLVLEKAGIDGAIIFHEGGIGRVTYKVDSRPGTAGMIDEDPEGTIPRALANFEQFGQEHGMKLLYRYNSPMQTLVVLCPRLEEWLYARAREIGVDPDKYGLPSDPDRYHAMGLDPSDPWQERFIEDVSKHEAFGVLNAWMSGKGR